MAGISYSVSTHGNTRKQNMRTLEQVNEIAAQLRKDVDFLISVAQEAATKGTVGIGGSVWAEMTGEILRHTLTLARGEELREGISQAAFDIGFTMAAFDNESATGSDADMRTLAKNTRAFSKALCESAVNDRRKRN